MEEKGERNQKKKCFLVDNLPCTPLIFQVIKQAGLRIVASFLFSFPQKLNAFNYSKVVSEI